MRSTGATARPSTSGRRDSMQGIEEIERICYQNELDRAERHMNETYEEGESDFRDCLGWELGECWACPHEGTCFPDKY